MWSCQEWRHATVTAPERNLQWEVPAQDIRWQLLWVIYHSQARQLLHSIPPVVHTIIVNSLPYILLVCDICQLIPDHPFPWAKFIPTLTPLCSLPCLGLSPSMLRKMLQLWMKNALWLGFCWVLRLTSDWKKTIRIFLEVLPGPIRSFLHMVAWGWPSPGALPLPSMCPKARGWTHGWRKWTNSGVLRLRQGSWWCGVYGGYGL